MVTERKAADEHAGGGGATSPADGRRELRLFFGLAIPLSLLFWLPMILQARGQLNLPVPTIALSTLGGLSPVFALVLVGRFARNARLLASVYEGIRPRQLRVNLVLGAVLTVPLLTIITSVLGRALGLTSSLVIFAAGPASIGPWLLFAIPAHFIASLATSPLFEEPSWRGFALSRLESGGVRPLVASLIVGCYWWLWHQGMNVAFGLLPTWGGFFSQVALSFVIDGFYRRSGNNIFAAMLVHQGAGTSIAFLDGQSAALTPVLVAVTAVAAVGLRVLPALQRHHTAAAGPCPR